MEGSIPRDDPSLDPEFIRREFEKDEARARAEYGAEFRADIESFISREAVEACVQVGLREQAPLSDFRYQAFVDPSGGSRDSFTLAIAHRAGEGVVSVDTLRERWPPFSPEAVVEEFATLLKDYRIAQVVGDRYAGEWPREQFAKRGIRYEPAPLPKSALYNEILAALNSRRVELVDNRRLIAQLCALERRTSRAGRDSIDHSPGAHDDVANAVAGVVHLVLRGRAPGDYGITL